MAKETLFISHATPADNTFAVWLATKLELCGYNVWVDVNNLDPSVDFWNTIENTIRNDAIKFIFVTSKNSIDSKRDGVQKELAVADKVRRQNPNFIVPLRIDDVDFNDFPVELIRLNAIDFKDDWGKGLALLLEYLDKENIPKTLENKESSFYLKRWYNAETQIRSEVTDDEDNYTSNFFKMDVPPYLYVYYTSDVEDKLKELHIPVKKNKSIILTFACDKCVKEWCNNNIVFEKIKTTEILEGKIKEYSFFDERLSNLYNDTVSLINWSLGEMFYKHNMRRYKTDNGKTSRNVYYFPYDTKSKRSPSSRAKRLSGKYKGIKRWHYALSGYYTDIPEPGVILKWHLVFSDQHGILLSNSSQIAARRSKGKRMYNKEWKEWLEASMFLLSAGSDNIYCETCCEENAMYIRSKAQQYLAEKSYIEPYIYKQPNEDDEIDE